MPDGCASVGGNGGAGACPSASATRDVYYAYDLAGRPAAVRFDSGVGADAVTFQYDALDRVQSTTTSMANVSRTLSYAYDAGGRRTRIVHPDGVYFDTGYDALDRATNASWWSPAGGTVPFMTLSYDDLGRRTGTTRASSATGYGYDTAGRLSTLTQSFAGGNGNATTTFTYNPAGQIASATRDNDSYAFTGHYNVDRGYGVNGLNQLTSAGPVALGHDGAGNLVTSGSTTYGYDAENRLVSASNGATLTYDPLGRLWQTAGGAAGVTQFLYDGDHVVAEYDGSNVLKRRYMWGPGADEPIVAVEGAAMTCTGARFLHGDERGSIVAQADCWGNRQAVDAYDEYGIPNAGNAAVGAGGRFGYTGQMWLPELGLWYYKARMYSPTLGRFMQTDPIGYGDGLNWYDYVGGDPVNATDPSGLISRKACRGTINEDSRECITRDPGNANAPVRREPLDWEKEGDDIVVTGTRLPSVSISGLLSAIGSRLSGMAGLSAGYLGLSSPQSVKNKICEAGNSVVAGSNNVGDAALATTAVGATVGGIGIATGNPILGGLGADAIAVGGVLGLGAGAMQVSGGVMQGLGGGG